MEGKGSVASRVLQADVPPPEGGAAWTSARFGTWGLYHPSGTAMHVLASGSLLLAGDGEHPLLALDTVTGQELWKSELARLPVLAAGERVLATTPTDPVWLDRKTGAASGLTSALPFTSRRSA